MGRRSVATAGFRRPRFTSAAFRAASAITKFKELSLGRCVDFALPRDGKDTSVRRRASSVDACQVQCPPPSPPPMNPEPKRRRACESSDRLGSNKSFLGKSNRDAVARAPNMASIWPILISRWPNMASRGPDEGSVAARRDSFRLKIASRRPRHSRSPSTARDLGLSQC